MQHADGEILAARARQDFGVPFTLSTMSICSIEDVAEHAGPGFWFQLYVMRDRDYIERLIDRAKAAGCSALQLTLDLQILGQRHGTSRTACRPPKPTLSTSSAWPKAALVPGHTGHQTPQFRQHRRPCQGRGRHVVTGLVDGRNSLTPNSTGATWNGSRSAGAAS